MTSLNKYMHPRNIYKTAPSFKDLAVKYPEFRKYAKQDITGKIRIDFRDPAALRTLTRTLLQHDFGLIVDIPENHLVPTLPLRLNYLLWVEDLLTAVSSVKDDETVWGVDIGTGAACVYPLLAAKKNQWNMLATEVDADSVVFAQKNVTNNKLDKWITVKNTSGSNTILTSTLDPNICYDFTMCNPPFFHDAADAGRNMTKGRTPGRAPPRNACTGTLGEVTVQGGEVEFVTKLIHESMELQNNVRIFSTMLGHKSSVAPLKQILREVGQDKVRWCEAHFCQGHTMRWGLAWTYDANIRLSDTSQLKKPKEVPPLVYIVPKEIPNVKYLVPNVYRKIKSLLQDLTMEIEEIKCNKYIAALGISAAENTWSHQRMKKRKQQQKATDEHTELPSTSMKRARENDDEDKESDAKHFRTDPDSDTDSGIVSKCSSVADKECIVKCKLFVQYTGENIKLQMFWAEGSRDAMHQILQFIKNALK